MHFGPRIAAFLIRVLRFCNVLDDVENKLSPVKLNVWAANMGAVGTAIGTGFAWVSGHVGGIEPIYAGMMTWLTHAHTVHHFDKRERNVQQARMGRVNTGQANIPPDASHVTTVRET